MNFADIHNHILFGVDDGAQDESEMRQMIDVSYADGVRELCFTPHYHPGYFGERSEQIESAFQLAQIYASEQYPELTLYLGNELRYERSCIDWLEKGKCRTLNGTNYLLVDFLSMEDAETIMDAMLRIVNAGYSPVLAHVERYQNLRPDLRDIERMKAWGVIIQVNARSLIGGFGHGAKIRSRRILSSEMIDLIASDAHSLNHRPPQLSQCYTFVEKRKGEKYAQALFWDNPRKILQGKMK